MRYDGGKGVCYAQIINLMPPHTRYIESHLGGGAIMRNKRPANEQIGVDINPHVIEKWGNIKPGICSLVNEDAVGFLERTTIDNDTLIYADPPYHPDTRRRARVYAHDYSTEDHERLLDCLISLPCKVIISGYYSPLYESRLAGWSSHRFMAKTHTDMREEWVWFNYQKPRVLHDYRYLGQNFREREMIRRRQERLRNRVNQLPPAEQVALYSWLEEKRLAGDWQ